MRIKFTASLTGATRYDDDAKIFVSFCPALNIYAQGSTQDEAAVALKSTIMLYLETCYAHQILEQVLRKAGFTSVAPSLESAQQAADEFIKIEQAKFESVFDMEIPLNLIAAEANARKDDSRSPVCV